MGNVNIRVSLGTVDLDALQTEEEIRAAAKALVPTALREIGEAAAEEMWKQMQKAFSGPGFKANNSSSDKRKFIEEAGRKYERQSSISDKKEVEDYIVAQIHEQKNKTTNS